VENCEVISIYNYLYGVKEAFFKEPSCPELRQEIMELHKGLSTRMLVEEKRKLLRLMDAMEELQDRISTEAFAAGLRFSFGLATELQEQEPFSFTAENERRACADMEERRYSHEQKQTRL